MQTFPLLDPYHADRAQPADGPILDHAPLARREDAATIFAYLRKDANLRGDVADALRPFASRLHAFGAAISGAQAADLTRRGARIDVSPPPLARALAASRLFVHLGGTTSATEALAAGVPQLVLSVNVEKDLNGEALERAGTGKLMRMYDPGTTLAPDHIEAMLQDEESAARAAALGASHREFLSGRDALGKFEQDCLRLLCS